MSAISSSNDNVVDMEKRQIIVGGGLEDLLSSPDAVTQIEGRALATSWPDEMQAWIQAEQQRPGANHANILIALANLQIKFHSSVAAYVINDTGARTAQNLVLGLTQAIYIEHFMRCRAHIKEGGGR